MEDGKDDLASPDVKERRAYRRARVLWGAMLRRTDGQGELPCTVANVSAGGAKLVFDRKAKGAAAKIAQSLKPGVIIDLCLPAVGDLPGEIVWCDGGRLGMKFTVPPEEVASLLGHIVAPISSD